MPTKWKSFCLALGAVFLVTGCEVAPQMELVSSNLYVSDRKPVAAAIVVPPASRRFSTARDLPSGCLGTITFQPAPYGENFEQAVRDRFSRIFETVAVVPTLATTEHSDIFFEATISDIGQRFGCPISPEAFVDVKASLRALDADGRELWRSATTSHRYNTGLLMYDPNREVGLNFSKAIAGIVDKWIQEVLALPPKVYGANIEPAATRVAARTAKRTTARRGFSKASLEIEFTKVPPRPDDIAVIIGNADYASLGKDIPDVLPARADAAAFRRYAIDALGVREGNVIDLGDATGAQMARVFGTKDNYKGQLFDWVRPRRSRVYVYYAGHGAPAGTDGSAYLVPTDADAARIELNGYRLETLYENLRQIPAASITVVLEACFSGASQAGAVLPRASGIYVRPRVPEVPGGITVIAAGGEDQIASWEEDNSHGLFTKYYLTGMAGEADAKPYGNGDGRVAWNELDAYLKETLTYYARRYYGRDQTARIVVGKGS